MKLYFTANDSTMYQSYYDKVCELLYGRVVTCLHNSSLRLNHHFFLIALRRRIRQILLHYFSDFYPCSIGNKLAYEMHTKHLPRLKWLKWLKVANIRYHCSSHSNDFSTLA